VIRDAVLQELERERQRLGYVAATRARELLVLPRLDVGPGKGSWGQLVDLRLAEIASIDVSHLPTGFDSAAADRANGQTREVFAAEAARIVAATRKLSWLAPSRDENPAGRLAAPPEPTIMAEEEAPADAMVVPQGSRLRGLVIHKLIEEVLTGELEEDPGTVCGRADGLLKELGAEPQEDPALGASPAELAECVFRALALPEIAAVKARLIPEMSVYDLAEEDSVAMHGIADAIVPGDGNSVDLVVDWKSDVAPPQEAIDHYRRQVDTYRRLVGAPRGLVVFVTSGRVEPVGA
jgi:exodeoxyribonuclease-5